MRRMDNIELYLRTSRAWTREQEIYQYCLALVFFDIQDYLLLEQKMVTWKFVVRHVMMVGEKGNDFILVLFYLLAKVWILVSSHYEGGCILVKRIIVIVLKVKDILKENKNNILRKWKKRKKEVVGMEKAARDII